MGTSQKAFDQVKSILGKLDRNIDQLRERRTGGPLPRPATLGPATGYTSPAADALSRPATTVGPNTYIGQGSTNANATNNTQPSPAVTPPSNSKWGRAQPIRGEQSQD